jgi:hypothetical protein
MALADAGRCEEAELALREAERRLEANRRRQDAGVVDAAWGAVEECRMRVEQGRRPR